MRLLVLYPGTRILPENMVRYNYFACFNISGIAGSISFETGESDPSVLVGGAECNRLPESAAVSFEGKDYRSSTLEDILYTTAGELAKMKVNRRGEVNAIMAYLERIGDDTPVILLYE